MHLRGDRDVLSRGPRAEGLEGILGSTGLADLFFFSLRVLKLERFVPDNETKLKASRKLCFKTRPAPGQDATHWKFSRRHAQRCCECSPRPGTARLGLLRHSQTVLCAHAGKHRAGFIKTSFFKILTVREQQYS